MSIAASLRKKHVQTSASALMNAAQQIKTSKSVRSVVTRRYHSRAKNAVQSSSGRGNQEDSHAFVACAAAKQEIDITAQRLGPHAYAGLVEVSLPPNGLTHSIAALTVRVPPAHGGKGKRPYSRRRSVWLTAWRKTNKRDVGNGGVGNSPVGTDRLRLTANEKSLTGIHGKSSSGKSQRGRR